MTQITFKSQRTKVFLWVHFVANPPFQDKRCESGSLLLFEILHFRAENLVLRAKFSIAANFYSHICHRLEITAIIKSLVL